MPPGLLAGFDAGLPAGAVDAGFAVVLAGSVAATVAVAVGTADAETDGAALAADAVATGSEVVAGAIDDVAVAVADARVVIVDSRALAADDEVDERDEPDAITAIPPRIATPSTDATAIGTTFDRARGTLDSAVTLRSLESVLGEPEATAIDAEVARFDDDISNASGGAIGAANADRADETPLCEDEIGGEIALGGGGGVPPLEGGKPGTAPLEAGAGMPPSDAGPARPAPRNAIGASASRNSSADWNRSFGSRAIALRMIAQMSSSRPGARSRG